MSSKTQEGSRNGRGGLRPVLLPLTALVLLAPLGVWLVTHGAAGKDRLVFEPAHASTLEALGDLAEGVPIGPYQISGVTEPVEGAVMVHASSPRGGDVTYEVRLASDPPPLPAARGGRFDVYYRMNDAGTDVLNGAIALGHLLERAPANAAPIPGLTKYFAARGL